MQQSGGGMNSVHTAATFRDPAGSLVLSGDHAVRTIHPCARRATLQFVASHFYQRMAERGDIVGTLVDDSPDGLRLLHPRVPIPSYPWEWTPSQWLAAAQLTLDLCEEGLSEGWILKDATPLNILFIDSRPVLVDVLSFEQRDPTSTIWLAYAQYVRTFLLPLVMHRLLGWPLQLSLFKRDGYVPQDIYCNLSWRQRLSRGAFWNVTLPVWLDSRRSSKSANRPESQAASHDADPELVISVLRRRLHALRRHTLRAVANGPAAATVSSWSDYPDARAHYSQAQAVQKRDWVRDVLQDTVPDRVLDVGANTGEFSALAAELGAHVVAVERDAVCAEQIYRMSRDLQLPILTLHADLARPTPASGWEHAETGRLLPRLEGRFDMVMLLAVIHHLLLLEQIPPPRIIALCHRLTLRHLVIEWVPAGDPMFQEMMRGRDHLYGHLTEQSLLKACAGQFRLLRQDSLQNGRILYLFEKLNITTSIHDVNRS
jgi:SAM-dependent methyltransferase